MRVKTLVMCVLVGIFSFGSSACGAEAGSGIGYHVLMDGNDTNVVSAVRLADLTSVRR